MKKSFRSITAPLLAVLMLLTPILLTGCADRGPKESVTYEISEEFSDISLDTRTADINLYLSEDGGCSVVCRDRRRIDYTASVVDSTLKIIHTGKRRWLQFPFSSDPEIDVYLPKEQYSSLKVEATTGEVNIPQSFLFDELDINLSTGDVYCCASVKGACSITSTTGSITVENMSADALTLTASTGNITARGIECRAELKTEVSTGEVRLSDITCQSLLSEGSSGDIELVRVAASGRLSVERDTGEVELEHCDAGELHIDTDTGDVELERCDAAEVYINTDTGDVEGSFRTNKIIFAESDTGRVNVPRLTEGGKCEINTDTGDIEIEIVGE